MFRKLITTLLLVATVAGPQWCCCKMRQWLAGAVPNTSVAQQIVSLPACCRHSGSSGSEKQSPSDPSSCPCKQHTRDVTPTASTAEVVQDLLRSTDRIWDLLVVDALTVSGALIEPCLPSKLNDGYVFAPLGGRDLLRAYQVMRC